MRARPHRRRRTARCPKACRRAGWCCWPYARSRAVAACWQPGGDQRTIQVMPTGPLPRGTLTFLFTDIEGSTKLLNALGTDKYHEVLEAHTVTLREAFAKGHEVRIEGDALFMVFATARDALDATAKAQRAL